jgi:nucleoid-associated protein YgaU
MSTTTRRALGAAALLTVALSVLTAAAATLGRAPLRAVTVALSAGRPWSAVPLETLLAALAAAVLSLAVAWLALVTLAAVLEALTGLGSHLVRAVTPTVLRRLVTITCGLALGGGGALAGAAEEPRGVLDGLPLPDRAAGAPVVDHRTPPEMSRAAPPTYRVRPGDSLWAIAEHNLTSTATTARVDDAWRVLYRTNRSRVGPDPDVLLPGTTLHLPRQGDRAPDPDSQRKETS